MIRLWCRLFGHRWATPWVSGNGHVCKLCKEVSKAKRFGKQTRKGWSR